MAFINVVKLEKLFFRCHKILPLVYDESLSYYEVLCKVANSLNEVIEATNDLNDNVTELNGHVNTLQGEVEELANEINRFEAEMNAKFDDLEASLIARVDAKVDAKLAEVDGKIDAMEREIEMFKETLDTQLAQFEVHINQLISTQMALIDEKFNSLEDNLKAYIYSELQKVLDSIPEITTVTVYDPTTGQLADIQSVIYHLYDAVRVYALSCDEFDALGMTCDELDHIKVEGIPRGMTAYEWDMWAKMIIKDPNKGLVASYLTGEMVKPETNVDINNSLLKESGCYECAEFDAVGGDVDAIDGVGITAYQWDWFSNNYYVA